jgi:hypothetical protein
MLVCKPAFDTPAASPYPEFTARGPTAFTLASGTPGRFKDCDQCFHLALFLLLWLPLLLLRLHGWADERIETIETTVKKRTSRPTQGPRRVGLCFTQALIF